MWFVLNQASSRKHQWYFNSKSDKKRQNTLSKTPMKLSGGGKMILAWYKCNILLILLCHFSACWLPGSRGRPQPSQEVPEHLDLELILLCGARGTEGLRTLCAQSCWGQGKLCPWQEDWILMCFKGYLVQLFPYGNSGLIQCSAVCAN